MRLASTASSGLGPANASVAPGVRARETETGVGRDFDTARREKNVEGLVDGRGCVKRSTVGSASTTMGGGEGEGEGGDGDSVEASTGLTGAEAALAAFAAAIFCASLDSGLL